MYSKNKMQNIYNRYKESKMFSVLNAYSSPSAQKVQAFENSNRYSYKKRNSIAKIADKCEDKVLMVAVSRPKVVSYNNMIFTYGCEIIVTSLFDWTIVQKYFIYITPYNKYMCEIVNDEVISVKNADEVFN